MAADYPASTYDHTSPSTRADETVLKAEYNKLGEEIQAIEETLGANVHQSDLTGTGWGSLDARLENVESMVSLLGRGILVNLRVFNDATNPEYKVTCTADVIAIEGYLIENFNRTADITVDGAGGKQSGQTEGADEWWYIWAIYDPTGDNHALFLSQAPSLTPVLPGSYTKKRRVGAVRNGKGVANTDFFRFAQQGDVVYYDDDVVASSDIEALTGGVATTWFDISLQTWLPPTSRIAYLECLSMVTSGTMYIRSKGGTATWGWVAATYVSGGSGAQSFVWIPTDSAQTIQYKRNIATDGCYVFALGYQDNL